MVRPFDKYSATIMEQSTVKRIFTINLTVMKLLGFYPTKKLQSLYSLYSYAVYICFTIPVPILAAIHLLVGENIDIAEISDNSFIIFQGGCFIFKLTPFIFKSKDIRRTIFMLDWPIFHKYKECQEKMMEDCTRTCKQNTCLFLSFCVVSLIFWGLIPFVGSAHKFPIEIWLPFDVTRDRTRYIFIYLFITAGVSNGAISNGAIDPLVSGLACFAATQLRILKNNLEFLNIAAEHEIDEKFPRNSKFDEKEILKNRIIYSKIKDCIRHHEAILRFVENYEKVYSPVVFTQFAASVLVVCVSCLQLSMVEPFTFSFFAMILFLLTMLLEIFLYSYFGTTLYEESNSLTAAIYKGTWYEYDIKSKKALIILMERSKKPIIVTAGKILELSLNTFTTILRRAYSLLAVLRNYQLNL